MKIVAVAFLVCGLLACGPDVEEECESFCELIFKCTDGLAADEVDECEDECVDDAEDDDECMEALQEFNECTGGACGQTECASEANALDAC
jgi:hypothetical protein